ncbi:MAG: ABC transporter ATP-binding protein [Clostridiales Family XIII bacterium]|nr:ABC transporter ATP-binding protein [Clostridiales Family XIII bacterium]
MNTIHLNDVSKRIKKEYVLRNINLTFNEGCIYGLHGINGSGKTMLLRAISGLIKPTEGTVSINEKILHKDIDFPESIGVLIETPDFWRNYTAIEVLSSLGRIKKIVSEDDIINALNRVGLEPRDKRTIKKFSLGMKQRLGIAQAIMEKPKILLLDEPTNALDKSGISLIEEIIKEESSRGTIIIIASHNTHDLSNCDSLIEIENGYII